jgi:hypothetical protein
MFDHAYAERPAHLDAQRAALAERLSSGGSTPTGDAVEPASPPMRGQRTSRR